MNYNKKMGACERLPKVSFKDTIEVIIGNIDGKVPRLSKRDY